MSAQTEHTLRFTVVGCGTAVPDADRVCSGYLVERKNVTLLLDCGPGVVHHLARLGLPWQRITHLALTHFHTDHVGDVAMLFFALRHGMPPGRTVPLTVLGPEGVRAFLERLADTFGDHVIDPGFPVHVVEMTGNAMHQLGDGMRLSSHATPHTDASVAYRVETPAGDVGYTGDTGYSEDVARFLQGTEILVSECSLPDDAAIGSHLTPTRLARMARIAQPSRLVITHVYPQLDRTRLPAALDAAGWMGATQVAFDGLAFRL